MNKQEQVELREKYLASIEKKKQEIAHEERQLEIIDCLLSKGSAKFQLPIGSIINGMRHLGGGRFIVPMPFVHPNKPMGIPLIIEGTVPIDEGFPENFILEMCDDPLEDKLSRSISQAILAVNLKKSKLDEDILVCVNTGELLY